MANPLLPMVPRLGSQLKPAKAAWQQDDQDQQDPFGLPALPFAPRPQQQMQYPEASAPTLTPEEESSLLGNVMGGVQYIGETVDKPFAAARGVINAMLGGRAGGGLLNLIPFSDTLGITDPEERVYGRDILETAGVVGANKPGLNLTDPEDLLGDVVGFALDIGINPLATVTGPLGTLTKIGQAATTAGKAADLGSDVAKLTARFAEQTAKDAIPSTLSRTPAAMAQQIRQGQRGLIGLKLPWQSEAAVTFGAGSEKAAKALETAAYGRYSPIRAARALFSQSTGGAWEGAVQKARDIAFGEQQKLHDAILDIAPGYRAAYRGLDEQFSKIQEHFGTMGDATGMDSFTRAALEAKGGIPQGDDLIGLLREHAGLADDADLDAVVGDTNALADKFYGFLEGLKNTEDIFYKKYRALGGKGDVLEDAFAEHFGRRANSALQKLRPADEAGVGGKRFAFWMRRSDDLRNLPGGSETINKVVRDMGLWGKKLDVDDKGVEVVGKMTKGEHEGELRQVLQQMGIEAPKDAKIGDLQEMVLWNKHLKPAIDKWGAENGVEAGGEAAKTYQQFIDDFTHAGKKQSMVVTKTRKGDERFVTESMPNRTRRLVRYFKGMPDDVHRNGLFDKSVVEDWFWYMDSLLAKTATLQTAHHFLGEPGVVRLASQAAENDVPLAKAWRDAGFDKRGIYQFLADHPELSQNMGTDPEKFINGLYLQEGAQNTLKAFNEVNKPANIHAIVKFFDKVTSVYKGALTIPWPSFHSRNLMSGMWQSWSEGKIGFTDLLAGYKAAWHHAQKGYGREVGEGGLQYIDEIINNGILGGHGQLVDIMGEEAAKRAGNVPQSLFGGLFNAGKTPLKAPVKAGEHLYEYVEFLNRAGYYEALRKGGYTPSQAMHLVKRSQFDYSALSNFEKNVMRRVVPFYSFSRFNLPYQLAKIAERPGGRTAQTIRAYAGAMSSDDGSYTPEFLREGMAIRSGGPDSAASFLKQTGIPIEDLNTFAFSDGMPNVGRTAEKFAARLHPLLTFLPETWAGKQFYTGREIKDLDSPTGRYTGTPMPLVDRLIHYSPVSRAVGEAGSLLDDRKTVLQKTMNALTGLKTGSYDVEKWKLVDYQNALKEQLDENPMVREVTEYYVPEQYKQSAQAPKIQQDIRRVRGLAKAVKNLKKKREAEKT